MFSQITEQTAVDSDVKNEKTERFRANTFSVVFVLISNFPFYLSTFLPFYLSTLSGDYSWSNHFPGIASEDSR